MLIDEKNQEKLKKCEDSAYNYFINLKSQNLQRHSNVCNMSKKEALKV